MLSKKLKSLSVCLLAALAVLSMSFGISKLFSKNDIQEVQAATTGEYLFGRISSVNAASNATHFLSETTTSGGTSIAYPTFNFPSGASTPLIFRFGESDIKILGYPAAMLYRTGNSGYTSRITIPNLEVGQNVTVFVGQSNQNEANFNTLVTNAATTVKYSASGAFATVSSGTPRAATTDEVSVGIAANIGKVAVIELTATSAGIGTITTIGGRSIMFGFVISSDTISEYSVTYDANGAGVSNMPVDVTGLEPDSSYTIAANIPARTGYKFVGWNDGTGIRQPGYNYVNINDDISLTAVWNEIIDDFNVTGTVPSKVWISGLTVGDLDLSNIQSQTVLTVNGNPVNVTFTWPTAQSITGAADPLTVNGTATAPSGYLFSNDTNTTAVSFEVVINENAPNLIAVNDSNLPGALVKPLGTSAASILSELPSTVLFDTDLTSSAIGINIDWSWETEPNGVGQFNAIGTPVASSDYDNTNNIVAEVTVYIEQFVIQSIITPIPNIDTRLGVSIQDQLVNSVEVNVKSSYNDAITTKTVTINWGTVDTNANDTVYGELQASNPIVNTSNIRPSFELNVYQLDVVSIITKEITVGKNGTPSLPATVQVLFANGDDSETIDCGVNWDITADEIDTSTIGTTAYKGDIVLGASYLINSLPDVNRAVLNVTVTNEAKVEWKAYYNMSGDGKYTDENNVTTGFAMNWTETYNSSNDYVIAGDINNPNSILIQANGSSLTSDSHDHARPMIKVNTSNALTRNIKITIPKGITEFSISVDACTYATSSGSPTITITNANDSVLATSPSLTGTTIGTNGTGITFAPSTIITKNVTYTAPVGTTNDNGLVFYLSKTNGASIYYTEISVTAVLPLPGTPVTFDAVQGDGDFVERYESTSFTLPDGSNITAPNGYSFIGWTVNNSNLLAVGTTQEVSENLVYQAVYAKLVFSGISFRKGDNPGVRFGFYIDFLNIDALDESYLSGNFITETQTKGQVTHTISEFGCVNGQYIKVQDANLGIERGERFNLVIINFDPSFGSIDITVGAEVVTFGTTLTVSSSTFKIADIAAIAYSGGQLSEAEAAMYGYTA